MENPTATRRRLLLRSGAVALVGALPSACVTTGERAAAPPGLSNTLVLLELNGGNDGLNTVIPYRDPHYARLRPRIGFSADQVVQLDARTGLHPGLAPLEPAWKAGEIALVQGVGYERPNLSHFRGSIASTGPAISRTPSSSAASTPRRCAAGGASIRFRRSAAAGPSSISSSPDRRLRPSFRRAGSGNPLDRREARRYESRDAARPPAIREDEMPVPTIVIHGGCGTLTRAAMSDAREADFRRSLRAALAAGWAVLPRGGSALDAVVAANVVMEDDPNFNAGHGAAFNDQGFHELDASIMEGTTLLAGAVAAARRIRNPIRVAAELLRRGADPLMLAGEGADRWAAANGFVTVDNDYFSTAWRREALQEIQGRARAGTLSAAPESEKHGTVGAVALDAEGHLAAGTTTGGYTNKMIGRVGDSPIIGAGTWADDRSCAISATGKGEFFIRRALSHEIHARIRWGGQGLEQACRAMIHDELDGWAAGAGLVAIDRDGNFVLPFNTEGMYRGHATPRGIEVAIYRE